MNLEIPPTAKVKQTKFFMRKKFLFAAGILLFCLAFIIIKLSLIKTTQLDTKLWKLVTNEKYIYYLKYPAESYTECGSSENWYLVKGSDRSCQLSADEYPAFNVRVLAGGLDFYTAPFRTVCFQRNTVIVGGISGEQFVAMNDCILTSGTYRKGYVLIFFAANKKIFELSYFDNNDAETQIKKTIQDTVKILQ